MVQKLSFAVEDIKILEDASNSQFTNVKFDAFSSGDNAHHIIIPVETLKKAAFTILEKPILWFFDSRFRDAGSHNDGEVPCGFVPKDSPLEYRELPDGRIMLSVIGKIWKRYSGKLIDILHQSNGIKGVSVEMDLIDSDEDSYGNEQAKAFCFDGITILGDLVQPAVKNAQMEVITFARKEREDYEKAVREEFSSKYKDIDFNIPTNVKTNAQKGLDLNKKHGRGGTSTSLANAKYLVKNSVADPAKIKHISKYIPKRMNDGLKESDPPQDSYISWMLWGGNEGWNWTNQIFQKMEEIDNKKVSYFTDEADEEKPSESGEVYMDDSKDKEVKNVDDNKEEKEEVVEEKKEEMAVEEKPVEEDKKEEMAAETDKEEKKEDPKEEATETPEEEKAEDKKEEMSNNQYLDVAAALAFLKAETESNQELVDEEQTSLFAELGKEDKSSVDMSAVAKGLFAVCQKMAKLYATKAEEQKNMAAENEELKKFKSDIDAQKKMEEVAMTLKECMEFMPKEEVENCRMEAEKFSLDNLETWKNAVKAKAFTFSKGKEKSKKDDVLRMGLPYPSNDKSKKSIWD